VFLKYARTNRCYIFFFHRQFDIRKNIIKKLNTYTDITYKYTFNCLFYFYHNHQYITIIIDGTVLIASLGPIYM